MTVGAVPVGHSFDGLVQSFDVLVQSFDRLVQSFDVPVWQRNDAWPARLSASDRHGLANFPASDAWTCEGFSVITQRRTTRTIWGVTTMALSRRHLLGSAAALSAAPVIRARAQSKPAVSIGVLTDLSGTYRDNTGPTSIACAQQAVAEFNGSHGFAHLRRRVPQGHMAIACVGRLRRRPPMEGAQIEAGANHQHERDSNGHLAYQEKPRDKQRFYITMDAPRPAAARGRLRDVP